MLGGFFYNVIDDYQKDHLKIDDFYEHSRWGKLWFKILIMVGVSIIPIIPLSLLRNVSKLRFSTLLGIFCLFGVAILIVAELNQFVASYPEGIYINWINATDSINSNLDIFSSIATLFFAYACHFGAFNVLDKLYNVNPRRIKKFLISSVSLDCVFFLVVGICGYLTQPVKTPELIITRDKLPGSKDVAMSIGRMLTAIMLIVKVPANYNAMRISMFRLMFKDGEITMKRNIIVTIPYCIATAVIGACYSDLGNIISFLGGVCCIIFCFFFPGFVYVKSNGLPLSDKRNVFTIVVCAILTIIGGIAGGKSLVKLFSNSPYSGH